MVRRSAPLLIGLMLVLAITVAVAWRKSVVARVMAMTTEEPGICVVWADPYGLYMSRNGGRTALVVYGADLFPDRPDAYGINSCAYALWRQELVCCAGGQLKLLRRDGSKRPVPTERWLAATGDRQLPSVLSLAACPTGIIANTIGVDRHCWTVSLPSGDAGKIPDAFDARSSDSSPQYAVLNRQRAVEIRSRTGAGEPPRAAALPRPVVDWDYCPSNGFTCFAGRKDVRVFDRFGKRRGVIHVGFGYLYSLTPRAVSLQGGRGTVWVAFDTPFGERIAEFSYSGKYLGNVLAFHAYQRIQHPLCTCGAAIVATVKRNASGSLTDIRPQDR